MEILRDFPGFLPHSQDGTHFNGIIAVLGQQFCVEVILSEAGVLKGATVNCDWNLRQILGNFAHIIHQRLAQCDSLHSFLKELTAVTEHQLEREENQSSGDTFTVCRRLIDDIDALGWDKLDYMDECFQEVHLCYTDKAERRHVFKLYIDTQYPVTIPKYSVELPIQFDIHWSADDSLVHAYSQFASAVEACSDFWDMLAAIDENTWVLEPDKPTYTAKHRRIAINPAVSIQVAVDPTNPRALPDCKFLGSDQAVGPLRQSMTTNLSLWNEERGILDNLQTLLDTAFPSPSNSKKEEFSVECGICYAYTMDTEIPDEVCNDSRCRQVFHKSCLVEWLRALSTSRQSFNTIFGNCPFCEKPMTVKMISR